MASALGQLNWQARQGRPDLSYLVSYCQQRVSEGKLNILAEVNTLIKRARQEHVLFYPRLPVAIDDLLILSVSDAALGAMPGGASQGGMMIVAATPAILAGVGPVTCSSGAVRS